MKDITIDNVEDLVYNYPTKHRQGFTGSELNDLLIKYEVNINDFFYRMGIGHTCMVIE